MELKKIFKNNSDDVLKFIFDVVETDYFLDSRILFSKKNFENLNDKGSLFRIKYSHGDNIFIYPNDRCEFLLDIYDGHENLIDMVSVGGIQIHFNYERSCKREVSRYLIRKNMDGDTYRRILCIEICPFLCRKFIGINKKNSNIIKLGAFF